MSKLNSYRTGADENGHFGIYGGRYVAETLMPLILAVEKAYTAARADDDFWAEFHYLMKHYVGRPSPLYFAERLTNELGGAKIYFKRDELNHTGAHKINNTIGQILLARRMSRPASSPKPALASMASPLRRFARCSGSHAWSTWGPPTSSDKRRTCSA